MGIRFESGYTDQAHHSAQGYASRRIEYYRILGRFQGMSEGGLGDLLA